MKLKRLSTFMAAIMISSGMLSACSDNNIYDENSSLENYNHSDDIHENDAANNSEVSQKDTENDEPEDITEDSEDTPLEIMDEEYDEMEIYNIAMQLFDTWMTGKIEADKAKVESVAPPDIVNIFGGDDYSPLDGYSDYEITQFLVTDLSEFMDDFFEEEPDFEDEFFNGRTFQKIYQMDMQLKIKAINGKDIYESLYGIFIKLDGKWYFIPDEIFYQKEPIQIGFTFSKFAHEASSHEIKDYIDENGNHINEAYVWLKDGTRITEEEYDKKVEETTIVEYGYFVEKNPDESFSFHKISPDGFFVFNDGNPAYVNGSTYYFEDDSLPPISSWSEDEIVNAVNNYLEQNWTGEYDHYCFKNDLYDNGDYIGLMIRWNGSKSANADSGSRIKIDKETGDAEITYINDPPYEWFNIYDYYVR